MNEELLKIKKEQEKIVLAYTKKAQKISTLRLILFGIIIFLIFMNIQYSNVFLKGILLFLAITFLFLVAKHKNIKFILNKAKKYIEIINRYINRCNENWKLESDDLMDDEKHFLEELNLTGKNSLFTYLNFTSSLGGKKRLFKSFQLQNISLKRIHQNQEAILELTNNIDFILGFQEILSRISHVQKEDFTSYLYFFDESDRKKPMELLCSLFLSLLTITLFILSLLKIVPLSLFMGLAILQIIASYFYQHLYQREFDAITNCTFLFKQLTSTYQFVSKQHFNSKLMLKLQNDINNGIDVLTRLNHLANLDSYRLNFLSYLLGNLFFSLNFVVLFSYRNHLKEHKENLEKSITSLEKIEVLISLSTIGLVKEVHSFPNINSNLEMSIIDGYHPLLNEKKCISNSFATKKEINIITGSNMSGKTSFMKMIGVNLVLGYLGSYVNAKEFNIPIVNQIFTSINVKDDLVHGISTFYGELLRMKEVLDFCRNNDQSSIVFVDEIFKGTNYNDRIFGAKKIIEELTHLNCIVFLTTHDFELCDMNNIVNYHFMETYKKDKIIFDYQIRKGRSKTTNAKYLMKMMNLIKEEGKSNEN